MRIENNNLKYNSAPFTHSYGNKNIKHSFRQEQSFGSGLGTGVISVMDTVERGGLVASFLIQDFLGMNIPRTLTGLNRNKDITGELNYLEAAEVGIREFLSGPVMFAVPMIMIWAVKRLFGKANDVPVNVLRALGDKFAQTSAGKTSADFADIKAVKQSFYTDVFKDVLKNTYEAGADEKLISSQAKEFAEELLEYEKLVDEKKTTKFFDKLRGKKVAGTADEKLSQIVERFAEISKSNAVSPSQNFLEARLTTTGNPVGKALSKLVVDLRNFTEDAFDSVSKQAKKGALDGKQLSEFFKKFTDMRTGSRVLTNASMILGIIGFCSYIPKLYQLSETNPGLKGIEGTDSKKQDTVEQKGESNKLEDKAETDAKKQVAFGGAIESLGRVASKKDGRLAKFFSEFEFDSYNCSFWGLLTACGLGVLAPRLYHAREENEYKEILFRDTVTIGTIACAAKILQQLVARACTKATGFALAIKPKMDENASKMAKIFSYFRPVKGHQVLTSDQLHSKYINIDKYKNGIAGFAQFVDEQGGDIRKMFGIDEKASGLLRSIYDSSSKAKNVDFLNATNKDLIEGLTDAVVNKKVTKDELSKLYDIFKDEGNSFLKKAKTMNSAFNFAIIFAVAPVLLGWAIPRLNESLTKKRQLEKQEHAKAQNDALAEDANVIETDANKVKDARQSIAIRPLEMKAAVTFKEFLHS